MSRSGRAWPLKLKERCEAVGWLVTMTKSGHYKVRTKRGQGFSFPSTPSDRRAERNALAEARRHGLDTLEHQLSLVNERERLQRIKRDRTSVGDALVSAVIKTETEDEEMRMARKVVDRALGYVDGVAIVEATQAKITTPLTIKHGKGAVPLADAEELLLEDGNVVYRCAKSAATPRTPDAEGLCHRTFSSVESLRAHITFHSRKSLPVTPSERKKREREAATRVAEATKTATTKASKKAADASTGNAGVVAQLIRLAEKFQELSGQFDDVASAVNEASAELNTLVRQLPDHIADEALLEKARKFDELRKQFG